MTRPRATDTVREMEAADWASLSDEELLERRISKLGLRLEETALEPLIKQFYDELSAKGLTFHPPCHIGDEWFVPVGIPAIFVPFFLVHDRLRALEKTMMLEVEGGTREWFMKLIRHEAAHAYSYAYKLPRKKKWQEMFGHTSREQTPDIYHPQPFSRSYVVNLDDWYAQSHPDEDFAETFAVWLTPDSNWEQRYSGWGALKKLQYVEAAATRLHRLAPPVTLDEHDLDVDQMEETVLEHYRLRNLEEKVDVQLGDHLDEDLTALFERADEAPTRADNLIRSERQALIVAVTQYSGVSRAVVRSVIDHLLERTSELNLSVHRDKAREYMTRLTSLLTALAMNYLYTDRFFEVD